MRGFRVPGASIMGPILDASLLWIDNETGGFTGTVVKQHVGQHVAKLARARAGDEQMVLIAGEAQILNLRNVFLVLPVHQPFEPAQDFAGGLLPDQADGLHPIELAEKQAEGALADFKGSEIAGPEKVVDGSLVRAPVWAFTQFVLRQSPSSPRWPLQHRGGHGSLTSRGQRASPE